ncbi:MAG TPA: 1-deoxy-D-xylulose-5-phosphate reductoisomerase [Treponemataceae bacterium]|jgi:1-deoxy-D-xylulose-5-phosphate reductoisomerase|nr:1-deoxy-D-xylulose-5-phosphate reductoisomerase [Treponemataceae bacterium]HQL33385.1 1-deoxy-D-xylulose-5-phosphate reductoisomerase [Treponemataceae bacterium]
MKEKKKVLILGATGSIGASTLDIIRTNRDLFDIAGISAHTDARGIELISDEFSVTNTCLSGFQGQHALLDFIRTTNADIVVNGIAGSNGMMPSFAALESGKDLALANKETIVMAGPLVRELAKKTGHAILPVDSEHSAVFNLVQSVGRESVAEIILTASGGPFRTWENDRLKNVKPEDALKHPTWSMGAKITIDSASLANKGLEVIEACRLFDIHPDKVKVVVHPQSFVHSLVRTTDGVLYAQISRPDMRHPILSALTWPEFTQNTLEILDFTDPLSLHFEPPRYADFPLLGLAYRAAALGAKYPIAYNASNEEAVAAFLAGKVSFPALSHITAAVLDNDWSREPETVEEILETDSLARQQARAVIETL